MFTEAQDDHQMYFFSPKLKDIKYYRGSKKPENVSIQVIELNKFLWNRSNVCHKNVIVSNRLIFADLKYDNVFDLCKNVM